MKHSPLQLRHIFFQKVLVEVNGEFATDEDGEDAAEAEGFSFGGVTMDTRIDVDGRDKESPDPRLFGVYYALRVANKEGKQCPYSFECVVSGLFEVVGNIPKEERETFVAVNGTTLLFGAVREQVANLTARSVYGMLLLPTVNFLDLKKPKPKPELDPAAPPAQELVSPTSTVEIESKKPA
jgi:preprotein translocase subunit SecB